MSALAARAGLLTLERGRMSVLRVQTERVKLATSGTRIGRRSEGGCFHGRAPQLAIYPRR
jgi:hypothetical protein